MKKILVTFDYEIFFGANNGSFDEVLFSPTEKILEIALEYDVKFTFFIDILSLDKMKNLGENEFVEKFVYQCKKLKNAGMSIGLHLHPHWESVQKYENGKFYYGDICWDYSAFRKKHGEESAKKLVDKSLNLFFDIFEMNPIIHRAGGLSIGQYEQEFFEYLNLKGIKYDSSVYPGRVLKSTLQNYDYSNIYSTKVTKRNSLIELPIFSSKQDLTSLFFKIIYKLIGSSKVKKTGVGIENNVQFYQNKRIQILLDNRTHTSILQENYCIKNSNEEIVTIIAHPKLFTEYSFLTLSKLIRKNNKQHDFVTVENIDLRNIDGN